MYLGLDIGTSSVKAVLMDEKQRILADASAPLTVSRPHVGWSEQNPESWWKATNLAVAAVQKKRPKAMAAVKAIGLSGQMHGAVLLDKARKVLRPAILWNDGRSSAECAELEAACANLRAITGNIAMPGFTAPKLLWVKKHEPKIFAATDMVLLPKDYIRLRMSGDCASDMSDSAGTLWLDTSKRRWSSQVLAATGLSESNMPKLFEGSQPTGKLTRAIAKKWGIEGEPVIAGGGGDNAAAACGIGAVSPGDAFVSLGTSGVLFVSNAKFSPNTKSAVHAFCHAVPDTWHQMGVILSAAAGLEWLAGVLEEDAAKLAKRPNAKLTGPSPVTFLPYLSGERTPHNDAGARGAFLGLSHETDRAALAQAVMEGVAFAFKDSFNALAAAGTDVTRLMAVGGGSRSDLWLQIIATVLGVPVHVPVKGDFGAAFGAARLAMIAATGNSWKPILKKPEFAKTFKPEAKAVDAYARRYESYKKLYAALKEAMQ